MLSRVTYLVSRFGVHTVFLQKLVDTKHALGIVVKEVT